MAPPHAHRQASTVLHCLNLVNLRTQMGLRTSLASPKDKTLLVEMAPSCHGDVSVFHWRGCSSFLRFLFCADRLPSHKGRTA